MSDLDTIIESKLATSVIINGLTIPAKSIGSCLINFCEPGLFVQDGADPFNLSKSGSQSKFQYRDRFFSITTAHQFKSDLVPYSANELALPSGETGKFTTAGSAVFSSNEQNDESLYDLRIFDFTEPVHSAAMRKTGWYDLRREFVRTKSKPDYLLAYGFPGEINSIDYDISHYQTQGYEVIGHPISSGLSHRQALAPVNQLDVAPSGMSGGSVFGITVTQSGIKVHLEGIISEASKRQLNYVPLHVVRKFLEYAFPDYF